MKTKITSVLTTLVALLAIEGVVNNVSAQEQFGCKAVANDVYFVDSGRMVSEVRPGSNGGNGYQLNILGSNVDKFEVMKEPYMTSVSLIGNYTSPTAAKWQIFFEPNMGRTISSVKMRAPECTGRMVKQYQLNSSVKLLDQ